MSNIISNFAKVVRNVTDKSGERIAHSETALGANASYTASGISTHGFQSMTGTVFADQNGTLYVRFSGDGTNYDGEYNPYSYTANAKLVFEAPVAGGDLAQVVFTNGTTAQATFRIQVWGKR